VTEEHEESPHLQRLLQRGKGGGPKTRRIMELNPDHPLITRLYERFQANPDDPMVNDSMEILFELALLAEGSEVADPIRLNQLTLELLQKSVYSIPTGKVSERFGNKLGTTQSILGYFAGNANSRTIIMTLCAGRPKLPMMRPAWLQSLKLPAPCVQARR
jgi:Hsp90 protein